jgi:glycosyltransferase involved in cell wall biosynthesis
VGLRVAIIVPEGIDRSGEYRTVPALLWLVERLAQRYEVEVFTLFQERASSEFSVAGAAVHNVGWRRYRTRALAAIVREHRRRPFDVLHAFWAVPAGLLAVAAGRLLGRPVMLHLAGGELVSLKDIRYGGRCTLKGRLAVKLAMAGASLNTAASGPMIRSAEALGFRAEPLVLGVDLKRWPVRKPRPRNGSRARLVHVGSLSPVKDQTTLLRALALLRARGAAFELDVVGADTMGGAVQRLAKELGLADCVRFWDYVRNRQLRPLVQRADLLVLSSRHEAGPVVLLEAAVSGVPTVGTRVGHLADLAPEAAVAVPVRDHEALAQAIGALLANDRERMRVAEAAQEWAVDHDADRTARDVIRRYEELTAKRR